VKGWDADLRDVKIGDYVASSAGWSRVVDVNDSRIFYDIDNEPYNAFLNGRIRKQDKAPFVFKTPPAWLADIIGPKPHMCELCGSASKNITDIEGIRACESCAEFAKKVLSMRKSDSLLLHEYSTMTGPFEYEGKIYAGFAGEDKITIDLYPISDEPVLRKSVYHEDLNRLDGFPER